MKSKKYECRVNHTTVEAEATTARDAAVLAYLEGHPKEIRAELAPIARESAFFICYMHGFSESTWGHFVIAGTHVYVREKVDS